MCVAGQNGEKLTKNTPFLDYSVCQLHRCWYLWKARQQCLLW